MHLFSFQTTANLLLAKNNDRKLVVYGLATMSIRCKLKPKIGSSNGECDACISHDNKYVINLGCDFHTAIYQFMILKTERKQDSVKI